MRPSLKLIAGLPKPVSDSLGTGTGRSIVFGQNRIMSSKACVSNRLSGSSGRQLAHPPGGAGYGR